MLAREIRAALREGFALVLMLLLLFSAMERGLVGSMAEAGASTLAGPICHVDAGAAGGQVPGAPASHTCCDDCALAAGVLVPEAPVLADPPAYSVAVSFPAADHAAVGERLRTPRQAQGPPVV